MPFGRDISEPERVSDLSDRLLDGIGVSARGELLIDRKQNNDRNDKPTNRFHVGRAIAFSSSRRRLSHSATGAIRLANSGEHTTAQSPPQGRVKFENRARSMP
jgi:hypothetical protein